MNKRWVILPAVAAVAAFGLLTMEPSANNDPEPAVAMANPVNVVAEEIPHQGVISAHNVPIDLASSPGLSSQPAQRSEAQALAGRVSSIFERYRLGDPSVSEKDLQQAEQDAHLAIENSSEARLLFAEQLRQAMQDGNVIAMFALERAFGGSVEGIAHLKEIYKEQVAQHGSLDWYALQGLNQLHDYMTDTERADALMAAFEQFDRYSGAAEYGPSLSFLTDAIRNPINAMPAEVRQDAIGVISQRLATATTDHERFFLTQSLYRLLPTDQGLQLAFQVLADNPSAAHIQAILEAQYNRELPNDDNLMASIRDAMAQVPLNDEQLALAQAVMGTPSQG